MGFQIKALAAAAGGKAVVEFINEKIPTQDEEAVDVTDANSLVNYGLLRLPDIPGLPPTPNNIQGLEKILSPNPQMFINEKMEGFPSVSEYLTEKIDEVVPNADLQDEEDNEDSVRSKIENFLCEYDPVFGSRLRLNGMGIHPLSLGALILSAFGSINALLRNLAGKIPDAGISCIDSEVKRMALSVAKEVALNSVHQPSYTSMSSTRVSRLIDNTNKGVRMELKKGGAGEETIKSTLSMVAGIGAEAESGARKTFSRESSREGFNPFLGVGSLGE